MTDDNSTADPDRRRDDTRYTKLTTKIKRGTGTRDQDTTKLVTRHPDPVEAAQQHQRALEAVRSAAGTARGIQPDDQEGA